MSTTTGRVCETCPKVTLDTFFGVSSETDDPPIGLERRLSVPEALRDGEIS